MYIISKIFNHKALLVVILALQACLITSCHKPGGKKALEEFSQHQLIQWNRDLTRVIIIDVFSPPVSSRIYAYTNVSAYEALRPAHPEYPSYSEVLNGLDSIPTPKGPPSDYYFPLSAVIAFSTTAQKMVFNTDAVVDLEKQYLEKIGDFDIDEAVMQRSIEYGRAIGKRIIAWASKDGYLQRNSFPAYFVKKDRARWQPTPPDYMDAVEPNWATLRPFMLDSASQFRPVPPISFDTIPGTPYFDQVMQVYNVGKVKDKEEIAIASFWDCNPNISVTSGHVTYFQQKISPGGHWLSIATSVCEKEKTNDMKMAEVFSKMAMGIADGFISCWDAKYFYNTIRPEPVINKYIDKDWKSLLQAPAFPEYPSGHSVISGAASTLLTSLLGDHYAYIDSTELPFGMPVRKFSSFNAAAAEASISRMYGGIHYLPSLNVALEQGQKIGGYMLTKQKKRGQ